MSGTFPSITQPDYPFGDKFTKRKIMARFESGHELSRTAATVGKHAFTLSWSKLIESEYQTLLSFFDSQGAETFDWVNPIDSVTYVVKFAQPDLDAPVPFYNRRKVSILLHQVP